MSTAAVMLVKDEADVIEHTVRHLAYHVDEIFVADNLSTDGTFEILGELARELPLYVGRDREVGHYQGRKTTALAMQALDFGHDWVVPCDADEIWYVAAETDRRIADYLAGMSPDVQIVTAELYHHLPTILDPPAESDTLIASADKDEVVIVRGLNPFRRIGWRNRERAGLPKIAARLRPDLQIHEGNHGATTIGTGLRAGGLIVRHFSWRSEEQYLRKIANGYRAFEATDLAPDTGAHWRMHGSPDDPGFEETVRAHFRSWFYSPDPGHDAALIFDPAPVKS